MPRIIAVFCFLLFCAPFSYAEKITYLVPESVNGPVTQKEIGLFNKFYPTYVFPKNNNEKKMSWDLSRHIQALLYMYDGTKDVRYIDEAVKAADTMIAAKNHDQVDYVTQRVIPGWPFINKQYVNTRGEVIVYNNIVANAMIMRALARLAFTVERDDLRTYSTKSKAYIDSSVETISHFIRHDDWFNDQYNLFHFPDNVRHDHALAGVRGIWSAYNRQLIMASAMIYVLQYKALIDQPFNDRVKYLKIVDAVAYFYWQNTSVQKRSGEDYLLWNYRKQGKKGKAPRMEDVGHGGLDAKCLAHIYHYRGIGEVSKFKAMANTLLDITRVDKKLHAYSHYIDGTKITKNPLAQQRKAMGWLVLNEWDRAIYDEVGWLLTNGVRMNRSLPYAEFLYYKSRYYGIEKSSETQKKKE